MDKVEFGKRLKLLRTKANYTQEKLEQFASLPAQEQEIPYQLRNGL